MAPRFSRNGGESGDVVKHLEKIPEPEQQYGEVAVALHPGFCMENHKYTSVEGLRPEDYLRHTIEFHRDIRDASKSGVPVDGVYRENMEDEVVKYLGELSDEVDNFVQSSYGSGFITSDQGKHDLSRTFSKVEDGGRVSLYGEINGLCFTQFEDLVEEVERKVDKDFEVVEERSFPEDPLDRTQGVLHWEEDIPPYVQALEFKSAYR